MVEKISWARNFSLPLHWWCLIWLLVCFEAFILHFLFCLSFRFSYASCWQNLISDAYVNVNVMCHVLQCNVPCPIQLLMQFQFAIILFSTNSTSNSIILYSVWIYGMWINDMIWYDMVVILTLVVQWLRLALSNGSNRVSASHPFTWGWNQMLCRKRCVL
jgi:hypothetical protein